VGGGQDLTKVLERATADSVEAPLLRKRGSRHTGHKEERERAKEFVC
jgi:hypothetical protein